MRAGTGVQVLSRDPFPTMAAGPLESHAERGQEQWRKTRPSVGTEVDGILRVANAGGEPTTHRLSAPILQVDRQGEKGTLPGAFQIAGSGFEPEASGL